MTAYELVVRYGARLIGAIVYDHGLSMRVRIIKVRVVTEGIVMQGVWVEDETGVAPFYLFGWEKCSLEKDSLLMPPHLLDQIAQVRWARRRVR